MHRDLKYKVMRREMVWVELGGRKKPYFLYISLHADTHTHTHYIYMMFMGRWGRCCLSRGSTGSAPETFIVVSPVSPAVWVKSFKVSKSAVGSIRFLIYKMNEQ